MFAYEYPYFRFNSTFAKFKVMAHLQHLLLLRATAAAVSVAAVLLFITYQPASAQTFYNSNLHNVKNWQSETVPSLAAFASYEDMNDYIANRNLRGLRKIDNPSEDSYIQAFNQHNEQLMQNSDSLPRHKRNNAGRKLPNEPKLLKFEISDAVEPSDAVKELIKKHRSHELSLEPKAIPAPTIATPAQQTSIPKRNSRKALKVNKPKVRTKRMTPQQGRMPPANFKVQMIPFDMSDAKESDAEHKEIMKRMRSLELEKATNLAEFRRPRAGQLKMTHKRARRSAPQMIKFELEDAKVPDAPMKMLLQQKQTASRESKDMKLKSAVQKNVTADMLNSDGESSDQNSFESKRYFIYKEPPAKVKKSTNSLPYEVQKVVTHLLKSNQGAKAYIKYLPAHKMDYNHFRSYPYTGVKYVQQQPIFGSKLQPSASFVKYYLPAQQKEQLQVQIHPVPIVEKVRYVYTPVAADEGAHQTHAQTSYVPQHHYVAQEQHAAAISQPIVVQDAGHSSGVAANHQVAAEVHHTYAADLSKVHQEEAIDHEAAAHSAHQLSEHEIVQAPVHHVVTSEFHASKPDPILEENKIAESGAVDYHQQAVHTDSDQYKYAIYPKATYAHSSAYGKAHLQLLGHHQNLAEVPASAAPLIKIEYHAPPDPVKENYKDLAEFKQLSHLMGKSPEDQIHGLTYLLAKEMQSKLQLQRQHKKLEGELLLSQHQRPQDSTAPILFHPSSSNDGDGGKAAAAEVNAEHSSYVEQSDPLIGMAKTKQYIPIVESKSLDAIAHDGLSSAHESLKLQPEKVPAPTSFVTYGLSPNYEQGAKTYQYARPQTRYATLSHHAAPSVGGHQGLHSPVQYAAAEEHHHAEAGAEEQAHAGIGNVKVEHALPIGAHLDDEQSLQYASKYAFGYRIRDFHTGNDFGHKQNRDLDGVTRGQYHILLPDGRIQNVIYHADDTGFHADVSFETGH